MHKRGQITLTIGQANWAERDEDQLNASSMAKYKTALEHQHQVSPEHILASSL